VRVCDTQKAEHWYTVFNFGKFFECFTSSIDYHIINGGGGGGGGDAPQLIRTGDGVNVVNA